MPAADHDDSSIRRLSEQQCLSLLRAAAVGRLGFVNAEGVQIIPVGYRLGEGGRLFIATRPWGSVGQLAETDARVAFEVDYHGSTVREGWSVLAHGVLSRLDRAGTAAYERLDRSVDPWPGYRDARPVQFVVESLSGRSVLRQD